MQPDVGLIQRVGSWPPSRKRLSIGLGTRPVEFCLCLRKDSAMRPTEDWMQADGSVTAPAVYNKGDTNKNWHK